MLGRVDECLGLFRGTAQTLLLFVLSACSGGGCSSCGGCGVAPISGGYPISDRIPNAAQVRLTEAGIGFLEANANTVVTNFLPDGLQFEIPETMESFPNPIFIPPNINVTICQGGSCFITGSLDSLDITVVPPNELQIQGQLRVRTVDMDGTDRPLPIRALGSTCQVTVDTARMGGNRDTVGLNARLRLVAETEDARRDYTKIEVLEADIDPMTNIEEEDINVTDCSGLLGGILTGLLNSLRGTLVEQLEGQVGSLIQGELDSQLCTKRGDDACPDGTFAVGGDSPDTVCRYENNADADCVPILLGADGEGDLGAAFLGGFSPGTHAPGQFLLAAGGDGQAVNDGMSVNFFGGFRSTTLDFMTTPGHNPCVPAVDPPELPMGVPELALLRDNTVPDLTPDPHVGIGVSESFLNYAGYGVFDSGMLCIGAGTSLTQQLSTGLFSLVVQSLSQITFPERSSEVSIALRPQRPPVFEVGDGMGTEPLLTVGLDQAQLDFYVWSSERFVRFMTYQADLTILLDLGVENGEILPMVTGIDAVNSSVSHTENLLTEDPTELAMVVQDVLTGFATMFTSGLGGITLPDLMGIQLEVAEGGLRGLTEGDEEFLGIFANLAFPTPAMLTQPLETHLQLGELTLDRDALKLESWREGDLPRVELFMDAEAPDDVEVEYSWRIDGQYWSEWTQENVLVVEDPMLLFQARHDVEVRARAVGYPDSVDTTPARAELLVDILAPEVELEATADGHRVVAWDLLSEDLEYRWRLHGDIWSSWDDLPAELTLPTDDTEVEVRDEAGNVGHASASLIRGRPNPIDSGACSCRVPGKRDQSVPMGLLMLLLVSGLLQRRRSTRRSSLLRRAAGLGLILALIVGGGCDCGGGGEDPMMDGSVPGDGPASDAPPPSSDHVAFGQLATYLDMAATGDGSLILSGYAPGNPPRAYYGDLVVGRYDASSQAIDWTAIDGVPDEAPTMNPEGFRGGVTTPGDDVGLWSSIVVNGTNIHVAYYDRTNGDLKLATGTTNELGTATSWSVHTIETEGDSGRYPSLSIDGGGLAVAYLQIVPPATLPGRPTSRVRVATAAGIPTIPANWTPISVAEGPMDCRHAFCPEGSSCTEAGECVMTTADCTEECARDQVCVSGTCTAFIDEDYVEAIPPAIGLFNALAPTSGGLALVYYDRSMGNIMGANRVGNAWDAPFLIDGYGRMVAGVGDCGIGADLAVDGSGVWHVSYVDGSEESLRYARVEGTALSWEVVDDGTTDGTSPNTDGRHIVGDDSSISVTPSGEVRIAYQDATSQRAMFARRTGASAWSLQVLDGMDSTGYWTSQTLIGTTSYVAHWWRQENGSEGNGVRVQSID